MTDPFAALDALGRLPPDWDGEGSPSVDPAIITAAREFLSALPLTDLPRPHVVPFPSGGVQLGWYAGSKSLEFEFESPQSITYLRWQPTAGIEDVGNFPVADVARAVSLIRWLANGAPLE